MLILAVILTVVLMAEQDDPVIKQQNGTEIHQQSQAHALPLGQSPSPLSTAQKQSDDVRSDGSDDNGISEKSFRYLNLFLNGLLVMVGAAYSVAAFRQLSLMQNAQRAWVTVDQMSFNVPLEVGEMPRVSVFIINTGNSPALNVEFSGTVVGRENLVEDDLRQPVRHDQPFSRMIIAPRATTHFIVQCDEPIANKIQLALMQLRQNMRLYVYGQVRYQDIFRKSRTTDFCYSWGGLNNDVFLGAEFGNDAS